MKVSHIFLAVGFVFLFSSPSLGAPMDEWRFRSKYDNFKVVRKDGQYFIGSSSVTLDPIKDFLPFFTAGIEGDCPDLPGKPDVVITGKRGDTTVERRFYLTVKQVQDGKHCADMAGEGIYFLPLHRSWFVGPASSGIAIGSTLKVTKEETVFVEFKKKGDQWLNQDSAFFTDWIFFNQFIAALEKHEISGRLHPAAAQDKKQFEVVTNGKAYEFYKVGNNLWGIKRPERDWLVVSPSFVFLLDMSTDLWRDRHAVSLATLKDTTQPPENRIQAVHQLGVAWSQAIKLVYHTIMLNPEDHPRVKEEVAYSMKKKPTDENFEILVKALDKTEDIELLAKITKILKIANRKGTAIQITDSQDVVDKAIRDWKTWWRTK
ncbi:MAG: hypothetical protein H6624_07435 [Bdellovibrionaceae bacterium]|nr:hypothetical protein [Bdellovibrionales bacterium]MCB9084161.1 hypothetical protein [Pseudobdellovibrionaceae bacterium]